MVGEPLLDELPFAIVDVETTGFSPRLHDRIIEIAVVRVSAAGGIEDEYVTLVNPSAMSARRGSTG